MIASRDRVRPGDGGEEAVLVESRRCSLPGERRASRPQVGPRRLLLFGDETGGATMVEFLGVAILSVAAFLAVAQMAIWVWSRNVAITAVHEGARLAAETGRSLDEGQAQTRELLHDGLGGAADGFEVGAAQDGTVIAVMARGDAPSIVPFLPEFSFTVKATAFDEDQVFQP